MDIREKLGVKTNIDFAVKLLPLNLVLFFLLPSLCFGKIIIETNILLLLKILLLYVFGLTVPLIFLYLAVCTSLLFGDIILHNNIENFLYYYI